MKRSGKLAIAVVAFAAVGAAITIPALAHGPQNDGWVQGGPGSMMGSGQSGSGMMRGSGDYNEMRQGAMGPAMMGDAGFMEHMMDMHSQSGGFGGPGTMNAAPGMGMMGGSFGPGMMGETGMMGALFQDLDTDGDGTVTSNEAQDGLQAALAENDSNGDATLSLEEFEALHSNIIRPMMVDRFQALDADGDGQVTEGEFTAPADWIAQMQNRRATFRRDRQWLRNSGEASPPENNN
ncbi:EF-hand domain-containing protein [Salipiger bermudensis]|uniref:EF-hand domain-containing protein n=1 Tax=Salipiger bermudensis TaxID=344736 RepID=UPI001F5DF8F6|nr:calcium-binding protein [Salipiger bermudensis]